MKHPITYRPLGHDWQGKHTQPRRTSPFQAPYSRTEEQLDTELNMLAAHHVVLQLDLADRDFRVDGSGPKGNASTWGSPAVILSFDSKVGPLRYQCDAFPYWQDNVRAIALGLEALRRVERYGIVRRGEQYQGWSQLPPAGGTAMPAVQMTVDEAARVLANAADLPTTNLTDELTRQVIDLREQRTNAFRIAARKHHPDVGGDPEVWLHIVKAKEVLDAHA